MSGKQSVGKEVNKTKAFFYNTLSVNTYIR